MSVRTNVTQTPGLLWRDNEKLKNQQVEKKRVGTALEKKEEDGCKRESVVLKK